MLRKPSARQSVDSFVLRMTVLEMGPRAGMPHSLASGPRKNALEAMLIASGFSAGAEAAAPHESKPAMLPLHVLVAEDNAVNRRDAVGIAGRLRADPSARKTNDTLLAQVDARP